MYNSVFILIDHKLHPQSACEIAKKIFASFINRGIMGPLFISNEIFNPCDTERRTVYSFRGKCPNEQKGQSSSPSWIASGGSSIESRELGHDLPRIDRAQGTGWLYP